jgi:hypothetical protein
MHQSAGSEGKIAVAEEDHKVDKVDGQKRLSELTMILGAIASDVFYDRVTPQALIKNLEKMDGKVREWLSKISR